jgi:FMS-like tyrosine kinase 1
VSVVAVKMAKPPVSGQQLMSLMDEIKIMQLIGKHINVVNLLGACTKDLARSELL